MPGMPMAQAGAGAWRFYAGVSAAKRGDAELAEQFAADLGKLREQVARTNEYDSRGVAIQEKQVAALAKVARGDRDAALALAKEAADIELTIAAPSGPPEPMKPAQELYGELLLEADRPADAARAFEQALLRTPRRTPSLAGLGPRPQPPARRRSRAAPTPSWRRCPARRLTLPPWSPRNAGSPPIRTETRR